VAIALLSSTALFGEASSDAGTPIPTEADCLRVRAVVAGTMPNVKSGRSNSSTFEATRHATFRSKHDNGFNLILRDLFLSMLYGITAITASVVNDQLNAPAQQDRQELRFHEESVDLKRPACEARKRKQYADLPRFRYC